MYDADLAKKAESIQEFTKEPGIKQVFAEMYQVIQHCSYSVKRKIPDMFVDFLRKNMDENIIMKKNAYPDYRRERVVSGQSCLTCPKPALYYN